MNTFYIPTSSLNFNNILSSESISPKAFYQARSFGYRRWTAIPENPFENSIVLFDQYCSFIRPLSDMEDHPLLIEVLLDDDETATLIPLDKHTYLSNHTIYINPFSTRFLFFSEEDKRIALSLSDSSDETKFVQLYRNRLLFVKPNSVYYNSLDSITEPQTLNSAEVEKDKKLNRMKGLLYGYYIGAILSTTNENVKRLTAYREIHDIMAAILSSFDHSATTQQRIRLNELYSIIQPKIPFFTKLESIVSDKTLFDAIVALVRQEYGTIRGEINVDALISQLLNFPMGENSKNPIIENINKAIKEVEEKIKKESKTISVDDGQIIVFERELSEVNIIGISESDKKLYKAWINEVLTKDEYSGKTSTFKEQLSDDVTRKAKEICEGEWKGSYQEITLNALRRHVRGEEYPLIWGNDIYSAISAVIVCGDDWQKMLRYMQSKGMTDYRIAFSMYGTINGFANLSREFTDVLFSRDSKYIADVYKEFYGQLFDKNVISPIVEVKPIVEETIREEKPQDSIIECKDKEIEALLKTIRYGKKQQSIPTKVVMIVCELFKEFNGHPTEKFYYKLQKIKGVGNEAIKAIRDAFGIDSEDLFSQSIDIQNDSFHKKLSFVTDEKALEVVDQLQINDTEVVQILKEDIEYIQNHHKNDYYVNDKECLDHLRKLIFSSKWRKHLDPTSENLQIVEQLISNLSQRYQ